MRPWQQRRIEFNHNWLKNRYLPGLHRFLNFLRDEIEDPEFGTDFLTTHFRAWEQSRDQVAELCNSFEYEMSPRRLLDIAPLVYVDPETRSWLGDILHHAWLTRYSVHDWVRDGTSCTAAVDACYRTILPLLPESGSSVAKLRSLTPRFEQLGHLCEQLARAIERFPRQILIV